MKSTIEFQLLDSSADLDFALRAPESAIIQVLREVDSTTLLMALVSASPFARDRVMSVLSERAKVHFSEDLNRITAVPSLDQIKARRQILSIFSTLSLPRVSGDDLS